MAVIASVSGLNVAQPNLAIEFNLGGVGLILMVTRASVDGGYHAVLPGTIMMGLGMGL